jgi:hypothetical protein
MDKLPDTEPGDHQGVWKVVCEELREAAWLAGMIGALSAAGVGVAVLLAAA